MKITGITAAATNGLSALNGAALVIAIGLIVVFLALIILTAIFWLFGKAMHRSSDSGAVKKVEHRALQHKPSSAMPQEGLSDEVVAVIAAAIAAMAPEGTRYAVRSIRRVHGARGERPVWAVAGIAENTRPF